MSFMQNQNACELIQKKPYNYMLFSLLNIYNIADLFFQKNYRWDYKIL